MRPVIAFIRGGLQRWQRFVLENVNKVYDNGYHAIHDLSLDISDGEFLVLVGPSGCGKSTALRMIAGLETISNGQMRIGEKVVNDVEPKDRDIAMVFQNYALYPHMTVYDNIGFALKLAKVPKEEIDKRVRKAADTLELTTYLDRKPGQLSGGQRQRVAMGRAIVRNPAAFLMDEPLSNLDAKLRVQMRAEIAALQRELGVTTFYVTHDQVEAMTMGDRVAVHQGRLPAAGRHAAEPLRQAGQRVRRRLHRFALDEPVRGATLVQRRRRIGHRSAARTWRSPPSHSRPVRRCATTTARRSIIGIRPEDFEDAALASNVRDGSTLKSNVQLIEALGSEIMVHFQIDAETVDSGDPDAVEEAGVTRQHGRPLPPTVARPDRRARRDRRVHGEHALLRPRHAPRHLDLSPAPRHRRRRWYTWRRVGANDCR